VSMERIGVWILNGSLCLVGLVLLFNTGKHVLYAVFAPSIPSISAAPPVSAGIPKASWQDRKFIAESHLFQSAGEYDGTEQFIQDPEMEETKLPLKLLGTVVDLKPKSSLAAIQITDKNESIVVRQGETVHGDAKVYRIERRRVVIINGRKTETLTLDGDESKVATTSPRRTPSRPERRSSRRRSTTPAAKPETSSQAQRDMIDQIISDPSALFEMADFRPQIGLGGVTGIRVSSVEEGSLIEQIGLKEGDVIKELNGIPITDPREGMNLLREFQNATSLNVVIESEDGQTNTLNYEGTP
jgi:general secretion pathway protein C